MVVHVVHLNARIKTATKTGFKAQTIDVNTEKIFGYLRGDIGAIR
jgi:hypothetical protein